MIESYRKAIFILIILFTSSLLAGQVIMPYEVDFGNIKKNNDDVIDLIIYNPDTAKVFLLKYDAESPVYFESRSNTIYPKMSEIFRIKINPRQIGPFQKKLTLYFNHRKEPMKIILKGKVKNIAANDLQKCPSFDDIPSSQQLAKERRKAASRIERAFVSLAFLDPIKTVTEEVATTDEDMLPLLGSEYQANNIIFLIDASSSMEKEGKFDLLKSSLIELLKPLRDIDYLSIITYAGDARVLLPPTSSVEKDSIVKSINGLHAMGSTNAIDGIDLAILTGEENFIAEGNNQIYLVTDGAFSLGKRNETSRQKLRDAAEKGLTTSVLAIKSERWTYKSLKEITLLGKGDIIKIKKEKDKKKVLRSIKSSSKK